MRSKHLVVMLAMLLFALATSPVHAGGVVSVCNETNLRTALAGGGTVTFRCSGIIILTSAISITTNTTIDGSGYAVTLNGNQAVQVFVVTSPIALNLNKLTIANGYTTGRGGGIHNDLGNVTVSNSTFSDNHAIGSGGAIYNSGIGGTLILNNSTFLDNSAGDGGGILNHNGSVAVNNSTFSGNSSERMGGGICTVGGELTVSNSTFSGNSSNVWSGAIDSLSAAEVNDSQFLGNHSARYGGAIVNRDWLTVNNSAFFENSANYAGSIHNSSDGTLIVSNSTFSGNHTDYDAGAILNDGHLIVGNSTFSGNHAEMHIGRGDGGAILNDSFGALTVRSSTFSDNGASQGGGIANDGAAMLQNTIVSNSPVGGNCSGFNAIVDGGGNLSFPDTTCPGVNADPVLGLLQNNIGSTETLALGPGSAAIDAGIDVMCAADPVNNLDQRGIARPWGPHCDIGAVEQVPIRRLWLPAARSR